MSEENVEIVRRLIEAWSGGAVVSRWIYLDRDEALEAAGLTG
jgi:hypothetical protein